MYSVKVRDHILIAHSLNRQIFGPAQNLHGATYIVDVEFITDKLDNNSIVLDIGEAKETLKIVLADLDYQNLDEHPHFKEILSTTENIAKYIHDRIKQLNSESFKGIIKVT